MSGDISGMKLLTWFSRKVGAIRNPSTRRVYTQTGVRVGTGIVRLRRDVHLGENWEES